MSDFVTIRIPKALHKKLFWKKDEEGFGDKSLKEYFEYITKDIRLNMTSSDVVRKATEQLLPLWMKNFANNLPYIRYGNNLEMKPGDFQSNNLADIAEETIPDGDHPPKGTAVVIGRGPSVFNHKHLDLLVKKNYRGIICATDGMLIHCLEKGIIPDLVTTVDGSPIIKKWYDHPLVRKYGEKLKVAASATMNHEVYLLLNEIGCKVYWFYPMFDDWRNFEGFTKMQRMMTTSEHNKKPLQTLTAGGNTGTCSWVMAVSLFKRSPVALIGIDFGYPEGTNLEETPYYSGVMPYGPRAIAHAYKEFFHPVFHTKATADAPFLDYRETFIHMNKRTPLWYHKYGGTINCTEGGTLWDENIKCMKFIDFLNRWNS